MRSRLSALCGVLPEDGGLNMPRGRFIPAEAHNQFLKNFPGHVLRIRFPEKPEQPFDHLVTCLLRINPIEGSRFQAHRPAGVDNTPPTTNRAWHE